MRTVRGWRKDRFHRVTCGTGGAFGQAGFTRSEVKHLEDGRSQDPGKGGVTSRRVDPGHPPLLVGGAPQRGVERCSSDKIDRFAAVTAGIDG